MSDLRLNISLKNSKGIVITDKVVGEVEALIYNLETPCSIKIMSENGFVLFDSRNCTGVEYVPIRWKPRAYLGRSFEQIFQSIKYKLNERLIIEVNSFSRTFNKVNNIKLVIRYD